MYAQADLMHYKNTMCVRAERNLRLIPQTSQQPVRSLLMYAQAAFMHSRNMMRVETDRGLRGISETSQQPRRLDLKQALAVFMVHYKNVTWAKSRERPVADPPRRLCNQVGYFCSGL
jgi:hypothetical protein